MPTCAFGVKGEVYKSIQIDVKVDSRKDGIAYRSQGKWDRYIKSNLEPIGNHVSLALYRLITVQSVFIEIVSLASGFVEGTVLCKKFVWVMIVYLLSLVGANASGVVFERVESLGSNR